MATQSHPKKKSKKRTGSQGRRKVDPPANPPAQELRKISAREFAARFANGVQGAQQSFTWFLGAGCSKSSGILDAGGLVEQWLTEQHEFEADTEELATWIRRTFPSYEAENLAKLYAKAFARRHPSPIERQREIELICSRGEPAYGYATLAQLLSHKDFGRSCNTVLTTNFDDLVADALYLYGERNARPLVVTHEALARYVRTNSPKPTVVKLHGDAHLDPKNLEPETSEIDLDLRHHLYPFLQDQALVFIGYGGNDESILKFVQNCPIPALAPPIFWVSKREPPTAFSIWLRQRSALHVDHTDFDQLMHLVRNSLGIELLDQKRWNQIGERYYQAYESLRKVIERLTASSEDSHALKVATSAAEKSLPDEWMYHSRAAVEIERHAPEKADEIFRQGLENFPESTVLIGTYASFLYFERADVNRSESLFKRAIDLDPTNVANLNNYAVLLFHQREDLEGAEHLFRRALDIEPDFGDTLANFAQLLLATGRKEEAKSLIDRKIKRSPPEITGWDTLDIELLVYRYAHQLGSAKRILRKLKAALSNGDRSPRWNFDLNYKRAKDEGHPNLPLLHDIIEVVTNKAGLSVLDSYKEWSSIKPDVRLQG